MQTFFVVAPIDDENHDGDVLNPATVYDSLDWLKNTDEAFNKHKSIYVWTLQVQEGISGPPLGKQPFPILNLKSAEYCGQFHESFGAYAFRSTSQMPQAMGIALKEAKIACRELDALPNEIQFIHQRIETLAAEAAEAERLAKAPAHVKLSCAIQETASQLEMVKPGILASGEQYLQLITPADAGQGFVSCLFLSTDQSIWQILSKLDFSTETRLLNILLIQHNQLVRHQFCYRPDFWKLGVNGTIICQQKLEAAKHLFAEQHKKNLPVTDQQISDAVRQLYDMPGHATIGFSHETINPMMQEALCQLVLGVSDKSNDQDFAVYVAERWIDRASELVVAWEKECEIERQHKARWETEEAQRAVRQQEEREAADRENARLAAEHEELVELIDGPQGGHQGAHSDGLDYESQMEIATAISIVEHQEKRGHQPPPAKQSVKPIPTAPPPEAEDLFVEHRAAMLSKRSQNSSRKVPPAQLPNGYHPNGALTEDQQIAQALEASLQTHDDFVDDHGEIREREWDLANGYHPEDHQRPVVELLEPSESRTFKPRLPKLTGFFTRRKDAEVVVLGGVDVRQRCGELADKMDDIDMSDVTKGARKRPTGYGQVCDYLRKMSRSIKPVYEVDVVSHVRELIVKRPKMPVCGPTHRDLSVTENFYKKVRNPAVFFSLDALEDLIDEVSQKVSPSGLDM